MTISVMVRFILPGSLGQLGVEVARFLRNIYGRENVIMSDIIKPSKEIFNDGSYILSLALLKRVLPG
jgi:threonine 3-dehydrogenase